LNRSTFVSFPITSLSSASLASVDALGSANLYIITKLIFPHLCRFVYGQSGYIIYSQDIPNKLIALPKSLDLFMIIG